MHVKNNGLQVSLLIFADDVILFARGSSLGQAEIFHLLNVFAHVTGQLVNFNKSQNFFSRWWKNHLTLIPSTIFVRGGAWV